MRIPPDFQTFLRNGDNKERLLKLIEEVWIENKEVVSDRTIYFARGDICVKLTRNGHEVITELATHHEEADTKIAYLIEHFVEHNNKERVGIVVRSSSGDTDIPIILLGGLRKDDVDVYIDNGTGKARHLLHLNACDLNNKQALTWIGLHAYSGNDYISSFLRRGKTVCWKAVKDNELFLDLFSSLRTEEYLSEETLQCLERFVCAIYGMRKCSAVNEARKAIFWKNLKQKNKITDISLLPPCSTSLQKKSLRANYVANMWRHAKYPILGLGPITDHGWLEDGKPDWINIAYPEDVASLLSVIDDFPDDDSVDDDQIDSDSSDSEDED